MLPTENAIRCSGEIWKKDFPERFIAVRTLHDADAKQL
jgi:hypothetical protein